MVTKGDRDWGRGKIGVEDQEIQTTRHKINQLQGCIVQHREYGYFIYNYKLTITFKNCESLCCISETSTILCISYTVIKKNETAAVPLLVMKDYVVLITFLLRTTRKAETKKYICLKALESSQNCEDFTAKT